MHRTDAGIDENVDVLFRNLEMDLGIIPEISPTPPSSTIDEKTLSTVMNDLEGQGLFISDQLGLKIRTARLRYDATEKEALCKLATEILSNEERKILEKYINAVSVFREHNILPSRFMMDYLTSRIDEIRKREKNSMLANSLTLARLKFDDYDAIRRYYAGNVEDFYGVLIPEIIPKIVEEDGNQKYFHKTFRNKGDLHMVLRIPPAELKDVLSKVRKAIYELGLISVPLRAGIVDYFKTEGLKDIGDPKVCAERFLKYSDAAIQSAPKGEVCFFVNMAVPEAYVPARRSASKDDDSFSKIFD